MFAYNTRTEIIEGARFVEQDIILLDYVYTGDILLHADAILKTPGFGFVIRACNGTAEQPVDSSFLITFSNDKSYRVIVRENEVQTVAVYQFIESATDLYEPGGVSLFFRKIGKTLSVYKAVPKRIKEATGNQEAIYSVDEGYEEIRLMSYEMPYDMETYQVGIYGNAGNMIRFAGIRTMAPSNWVSNVFNAGGGRIIWIPNGFKIEDAEYDIEAESQEIPLKAGTYWFDYQTDNPDLEAFIYKATRKNTADKRPFDEIIGTRTDERKNILEADGHFTLDEEHPVNIKFKGKWGTVTNICLKDDRNAGFVATGYGMTIRPGSRLVFDLTRIKAFHIKGRIISVPVQDDEESRTYHLFRYGSVRTGLRTPVVAGNTYTYDFTTDTRTVSVDGDTFLTFTDPDDRLIMFENMTAVITEFTVTQHDGTTLDILLQQTVKISVSKDIDSPILVADEHDDPLNLSAAYRKIANIEPKLDLFYAENPIRLEDFPAIDNPDIRIYGIPGGAHILDRNAATVDELADRYVRIPYTADYAGLLRKTVDIPYETRKQYKYIAVSYNGIVAYRYYFTNWERDVFDLSVSRRIYLDGISRNDRQNIIIYGIPDASYFNPDLVDYIPEPGMEKRIDLSAYRYDEIMEYTVSDSGRIVIDEMILNRYRYLVIDHLRLESYAINETKSYYEVDISTTKDKVNVYYDSWDGKTTKAYRPLAIPAMTAGQTGYEIKDTDFIVLETTA